MKNSEKIDDQAQAVFSSGRIIHILYIALAALAGAGGWIGNESLVDSPPNNAYNRQLDSSVVEKLSDQIGELVRQMDSLNFMLKNNWDTEDMRSWVISAERKLQDDGIHCRLPVPPKRFE